MITLKVDVKMPSTLVKNLEDKVLQDVAEFGQQFIPKEIRKNVYETFHWDVHHVYEKSIHSIVRQEDKETILEIIVNPRIYRPMRTHKWTGYAAFVEFGTRPHFILGRGQHPGARPKYPVTFALRKFLDLIKKR